MFSDVFWNWLIDFFFNTQQLFVHLLARIWVSVRHQMFVSVRKSSKAHSVSSRKVNLASKNPQLRKIHVLFAIQRHARRPATLVSPSPVEVRKFKWSATLEIGSNFNNHRERFRKLPIASVIIYYCTLLSFIKPRLNFWFLVILFAVSHSRMWPSLRKRWPMSSKQRLPVPRRVSWTTMQIS